MKTNITASQAMKIAKDYKEKYNLSGIIHDDIERSVKFYSSFYRIKGYAWLVVADIAPKIYEGDDEITYVISDEEAVVDHILDHNGIPLYIHLEESNRMTEEEFDAIWNDDSNEED